MKKFSRTRLLLFAILSATTSISAQTTLLWSESTGTSASSQKSFVATDLIGNIYMASSVNGTYGLDWKVSSWRPDSVSRWTYTYNGGGNADDIPAAIVVDSAFSVYVTGTVASSGSNDIRVIKLDSAGNLKWGTNYNRTGSAQDVGTGLAVVGDKLWVSGHSQQSTSNYDYTLLKYDTSGTLSWSRHADGSASGDDYTTAIAVRSNGDAYVTGNAVVSGTGSVRDIMTLRYTTDGTLQWTKYYGGTSGQHDYGNDVKIDASGNILVVGQTFMGASNSDLVLIKYTSGGTQSWVATYSGASKKHDAGNALIIGSDDYIYVTGFTQTSGGTNNYVTIRYNGSGSVSWAQTYDGPGASDDEACAIIEDGDDVVITGKSTGSGTGLDVCTISMIKTSGTVNWTMRINESGSTGDWGLSLCRDEMGNVIVSGVSQMSGSSFGNCAFKFNQSTKNSLAIKNHMQMVAFGLTGIISDTASKRVLYDMAKLAMDSLYKAFLPKYLASCDAQSLSTRTLIRSAIVSNYSLNSSLAWEKILASRIYNGKLRLPTMIYIPGFETFTRSGFISTTSAVSFSYQEADYPIYDVPGNDPLYETDLLATPTLTALPAPPAWWRKYSPFLRYCYAEMSEVASERCTVCGTFIPADGLPVGTSVPGCQAHELGIRLGMNYDFYGNVVPDPSTCVILTDMNAVQFADPYYAVLSAIAGYNYFEIGGSGTYQTVKKMPYPIYDKNTQQYGMAMTLCEQDNDPYEVDFNDYHGTAGYSEDYAIGWGGVFKLAHPGLNTRPVYFAFPFAQFLYYDQGPDINVYYSLDDVGVSCGDGTDEVGEQFFTGCCDICNTTQAAFGLTSNQSRDIIVTTDYSTISSYWLDNAITVGFNGGNQVYPTDHTTFLAQTSPTPCSVSSYFPLGVPTALCELELLTDGRYEIRDDLTSSCSPGDDLLVHVIATFSNGESINTCQTVTLGGSTAVDNMCVEIRGGINNYSSSQVNYYVAVYLLP